MSQLAQAIVFDAPRQLSVKSLETKAFEPGDIEVTVTHRGISTGTERLLWDGTMPPFPGLGYPLVPGYETVGRVTGTGVRGKLWGVKCCMVQFPSGRLPAGQNPRVVSNQNGCADSVNVRWTVGKTLGGL